MDVSLLSSTSLHFSTLACLLLTLGRIGIHSLHGKMNLQLKDLIIKNPVFKFELSIYCRTFYENSFFLKEPFIIFFYSDKTKQKINYIILQTIPQFSAVVSETLNDRQVTSSNEDKILSILYMKQKLTYIFLKYYKGPTFTNIF